MKPYIHAENSAKKYGGNAEDYLDIHDFMDSSKSHIADHRHRAIFHSSLGCFIVERVFGTTRRNSEGKTYSTRDIAEQHCLEDLGTIPSVQDWLQNLPVAPWMGGNGKPGALMAKPELPGESMVIDGAGASKPFSIENIMAIDNMVRQATQNAVSPFREALRAALQAFLDKHPERQSIGWSQYTPYFNDGDACVFGVGSPCWGDGKDRHIYPIPEELKPYFDGGETMERMFLAAFGDHAKVVLMRGENNFTVNECDHE